MRRDVEDQLLSGGYEVQLSTPVEFENYIASEVKKWAHLIKTAGIKAE